MTLKIERLAIEAQQISRDIALYVRRLFENIFSAEATWPNNFTHSYHLVINKEKMMRVEI
jgi:hypothetical protein